MKKNIIEEELALLKACKTPQEKAILTEQLKEKHKNDTPEQVIEDLKAIKEKVDEVSFEVKLLELSNNGISLSHMAKKYLNKSRSYLSQRINGNTVGGSTVKLSEEDKLKLKNGLADISKKLHDLSISLIS